MKARLYLVATLALFSIFNPRFSDAFAQGATAFTFQGRLNSAGGTASGSYDMTFAVWTANTNGTLIAGPLTNTAVAVNSGLFTVTLDFGAGVFTGTNYFVEMGVRTNGGSTFSTLVPRQQLTPAPYALSLVSPQATALCPPGSVMAFMGTSAPTGWLLCDGSAVSRTSYAALFAVMGTASGSGDGSTTFNLPDLRGVFLRGVDGSKNRDPDKNSRTSMSSGGNTGNAVGSVQSFALQNITGGIGLASSAVFPPSGAFYGFGTGRDWSAPGNAAGQILFDASRSANTSSETRPVNAYVNYIIKY